MDILIRAENRSTADTPFCGVGGGMIGDRLDVDAFMTTGGVVTGSARFEEADGVVTIISLDRMFSFNNGGLLVQNQTNLNTVAIWINDFFFSAFGLNPALVNVELPRGCENTKSTFTPGVERGHDADQVSIARSRQARRGGITAAAACARHVIP